jgi:homoserine dehydrogenase
VRRRMASVDVGVALLGYGTVGASVSRMLAESGDEIERATGHRLRVVRALVRDPAKERSFAPSNGVLTTDFDAIVNDPAVDVVAEVMGGLEPAGGYVRTLLGAGKSVVSANKQLIAREGADLFATASANGVQLRFEASVCAAIPVVKVLRESLIATNVHRVLGIVNGTTNFILSRMERGGSYADALAEAQSLGYAEADPSDDVNGADAAAKMAILATVAFGSRVQLSDVATSGITDIEESHVSAAAQLGMVVRLVGIATLEGEAVDVRVQPAFVERSHPLVVADLVSVVGTSGTGFLQNDACWRELPKLDPDAWRSAWYVHLDVADRPGVLAHVTSRLAAHDVSVAQLVQRLADGEAALDLVLHDAPSGDVNAALAEIAVFPEVLGRPFLAPVISERPL